MLKFDSSHKSVDIDGFIRKYETALQKIIIGGLIITLLSPIGIIFAKTRPVPCDIEGDHAHLYIDNGTKIERYIESERKTVDGLERLEDYRMITEEESELLKFENKNGLFRIDENWDELQTITQDQQSHKKEYRYAYEETIHWSTPMKVGKGWTVIQHSKNVTRHSWTTDENHEGLTGEERDIEYVYQGYRIVKNEQGKYEIQQSGYVSNLQNLPEGYNYIKKDFYKTMSPQTEEILDYEDGPEVGDREVTQQELNEMLQENSSEQVQTEETKVL